MAGDAGSTGRSSSSGSADEPLESLSTQELQQRLSRALEYRGMIKGGTLRKENYVLEDFARLFVPVDTVGAAESLDLRGVDEFIDRIAQELRSRAAAALGDGPLELGPDAETGPPLTPLPPGLDPAEFEQRGDDAVPFSTPQPDGSVTLTLSDSPDPTNSTGSDLEVIDPSSPASTPVNPGTRSSDSSSPDTGVLTYQIGESLVSDVAPARKAETPTESVNLSFGAVDVDYPPEGQSKPRPWWLRPLPIVLAGAALIGIVVGIILLSGGGNNSTTTTTTVSSTAKASPPSLIDRPLTFTMLGAGTSTPSTYLVTMQSGSLPSTFIETDTYPNNTRQLTTERFSSNGVEVLAITDISPTPGTVSFDFPTPLLVLKTPYRPGQTWTSTATGTSTSGQDTVHITDRITGVTQETIAGRTLNVIQVDLHHVVTETTSGGTVTQDSIGTTYFSPDLGVFISGQSTETSNGRSTTNQFQLTTIG